MCVFNICEYKTLTHNLVFFFFYQVATSQNKVYLSADSLVLNLQDDYFDK